MGTSFVASYPASESAAATTLAVTGVTNAVGNLLVAIIGGRESGAAPAVRSIADTGGNTWAKAAARSDADDDDTEVWWTETGAQAGTVTITFAGSTGATCDILEGTSTTGWAAAPVDATLQNGSTVAGTALSTGNSAATAQADEFAVAYGWAQGSTNTWSGQTAGWTPLAAVVSGIAGLGNQLQAAYQVLTATGVQSYAVTLNGSRVWMAGLVTFKAASGGGVNPTGSGAMAFASRAVPGSRGSGALSFAARAVAGARGSGALSFAARAVAGARGAGTIVFGGLASPTRSTPVGAAPTLLSSDLSRFVTAHRL